MASVPCVDCLTAYPGVADSSVNLTVVDPPYNIGFDYGEDGYEDSMSASDYISWCRKWLSEAYRVTAADGAMWLVIGDEYAGDLKVAACDAGFHLRSWVVWYYTFGVNASKKLSRSHTHLLYFVKNEKRFVFNQDAARVPSARALTYNDKRASPDGRLPDDTWILRPQELPEAFAAESDTWHIPRVCGTFKERAAGAANQLPEQLVARIIRLCSDEGHVVHDPMAGTGTVPRVAKLLNRRYLAWELHSRFSEMASARVDEVASGAYSILDE